MTDDRLPPNLGVRQRKKQAVMDHVQQAALDLFDARGFEAVTIEDVAAAAGVSPSTVYRHFGTKQRLITYDQIDRQLVAALLAHYPEHGPVASARLVLESIGPLFWSQRAYNARRIRYFFDEPSVYAAMEIELRDISDYVAAQLVERAQTPLDPLDADVIAHLLCETVIVAVRIWRESDFQADFLATMTRCLDLLESGLTPKA